MSQINDESAEAQSFVYASAYAIQPTPPTFDVDGANYVFVSDQGETEWPSDAMHFDSIEEASYAIEQLGLPKVVDRMTGEEYPMIVEMTLESKIRKVKTAKKEERVRVVA